jgi:hypothetical protein
MLLLLFQPPYCSPGLSLASFELTIFKDRELKKWGNGKIIQYIPLFPYLFYTKMKQPYLW